MLDGWCLHALVHFQLSFVHNIRQMAPDFLVLLTDLLDQLPCCLTTTSVPEMLENLSLEPLADHGEAARLTLMFKIMYNHVSTPPGDLDLNLPANTPEAPRIRNSNT